MEGQIDSSKSQVVKSIDKESGLKQQHQDVSSSTIHPIRKQPKLKFDEMIDK